MLEVAKASPTIYLIKYSPNLTVKTRKKFFSCSTRFITFKLLSPPSKQGRFTSRVQEFRRRRSKASRARP